MPPPVTLDAATLERALNEKARISLVLLGADDATLELIAPMRCTIENGRWCVEAGGDFQTQTSSRPLRREVSDIRLEFHSQTFTVEGGQALVRATLCHNARRPSSVQVSEEGRPSHPSGRPVGIAMEKILPTPSREIEAAGVQAGMLEIVEGFVRFHFSSDRCQLPTMRPPSLEERSSMVVPPSSRPRAEGNYSIVDAGVELCSTPKCEESPKSPGSEPLKIPRDTSAE